MKRPPPIPAERTETHRAAVERVLREGPVGAKELSRQLGIREKDVAPHLEHLGRSLQARGEKLHVEPAACLACGFKFSTRTRLTTPGRCPECSSERIEPPNFSLRPSDGSPTTEFSK